MQEEATNFSSLFMTTNALQKQPDLCYKSSFICEPDCSQGADGKEYDPIVDSYTPSSAAPAPAPGQAASLAPSLAPGVSQSADSPQGSAVPVPETPSEGSTPAALNPPSTSTNTSPSPSAAAASYPSSPSLFLFLLGFILFYFN
ncbi:hypothetical protein LINPERHAP2_LOCUS44420 [Linum perenne]